MKNPSRLSHIVFTLLLAGLALNGAVHCGSSDGGSGSSATLSVSVTGIGSGKVTSNVGNINCTKTGGACSASLATGTAVTLTPTPDKGFFFNGWLGACHGIGPCTITLNQATSVQASFVNIAFFSNRDLDPTQDTPNPTTAPTLNNWLTNSDGSNPHALAGLVVADGDSELPSFSPDGNQIVFVSNLNINGSPTLDPNGSNNVWIMNADGNNLRPLAKLDAPSLTNVQFINPRWSPDGSQIVFASDRDIHGGIGASAGNNIWVVNANDTNLRVLAGLDKAQVTSSHPVWSPDGTKIAFDSNRDVDFNPTPNPNNENNIWVMDANGNGLFPLTKLTATTVFATNPQWSPDGLQIVFGSNRNLDPNNPNGTAELASNIWKVDADGSHPPVPLTSDKGSIFNNRPQWSPDGKFIVFESRVPASGSPFVRNIRAVAADGSQDPFALTALTDTTVECSAPYWAPDSSVVIFDCNRNLDTSQDNTLPHATDNIWTINPDGGGIFAVTRLTNPDVFNISAFSGE